MSELHIYILYIYAFIFIFFYYLLVVFFLCVYVLQASKHVFYTIRYMCFLITWNARERARCQITLPNRAHSSAQDNQEKTKKNMHIQMQLHDNEDDVAIRFVQIKRTTELSSTVWQLNW